MLSVGREAKTVHYHISKEGNFNTECNGRESRFNQTSSRSWSIIGIPLFDVCGYFGTTRRGWRGGKASSLCIVKDRRRARVYKHCPSTSRSHRRLLTDWQQFEFFFPLFRSLFYAPMNFVLRRKISCYRSPSSTLDALIAQRENVQTGPDEGNCEVDSRQMAGITIGSYMYFQCFSMM